MTGVEMLMAATAVASTAVGTVSAIQQGNAAKNAAEYNAKVAENNAIAARQQADYEERMTLQKRDRLLSAQRVATAASGLDLEGSPLALMEDTAVEAELDALNIRRSGTVAEARSRSQAAADRMEGQARQQAGYMSAGASLLNGASKLAGMYVKHDAASGKAGAGDAA